MERYALAPLKVVEESRLEKKRHNSICAEKLRDVERGTTYKRVVQLQDHELFEARGGGSGGKKKHAEITPTKAVIGRKAIR